MARPADAPPGAGSRPGIGGTRRGSVRVTCLRAAIGSFVLSACLILLYGHEIADGDRMLSGDMFDGRIADALQLHWSRVFAGAEIWNRPDYFYPAKDTLGYNDGYFLFGVVFTLFRLLGCDVFVAAELAGIPFRIAGFAGIYALSREAFGLRRPFALLAATIGLLANNIHLQQVHEQLLTVYLAPVAAFLVFRATSRAGEERQVAAASYGALAAILVSLWAITAFYTLWFTSFLAALALLFAVALRLSRIVTAWRQARLAFPGVPLLFTAVGLLPFLLVYGPARQRGSGHSWMETFQFTLPPKHLLDVAPGNLLASLLGVPDHVVIEYSVGLPATLWLAAALGVVVTVAGGRARPGGTGGAHANGARLPLALASIVMLLLALRFGNHAGWRLVVALVPGAEAIRVVCRVMLLLGLVAAILAAIALEWLHARRVPRAVTALLALLLVVEEVNIGGMYALPHRREDAFLAHIAPPPHTCRSFVVTRGRAVAGVAPGTILDWLMTDTDAMLIAETYSVPTPLGDASVKPPRHATVMNVPQAILVAGGGRPVCSVDLVTGRWREVAPVIARVAPGTLISFEDAQSDSLVAGGWSAAGAGGRWTVGSVADLIFRWTRPTSLRLHIHARIGFGLPGHPDRVDIFANELRVASWSNDSVAADHLLVIPQRAIGPGGLIRVRFVMDAAISLAAAGLSPDDRALGVAVTSIAAE